MEKVYTVIATKTSLKIVSMYCSLEEAAAGRFYDERWIEPHAMHSTYEEAQETLQRLTMEVLGLDN